MDIPAPANKFLFYNQEEYDEYDEYAKYVEDPYESDEDVSDESDESDISECNNKSGRKMTYKQACLKGNIRRIKEGQRKRWEDLSNFDGLNKGEYYCFGLNPLCLAARGGHLKLVKYLVEEADVDIDSTDMNAKTALYEAAAHGHLNVVKYVLSKCHSETVNRTEHTEGSTYYDPQLEREYGASQIGNPSGYSPLTIAFHRKHLDIVKALVGDKRIYFADKDNVYLTYQSEKIEIEMVKAILLAFKLSPDSLTRALCEAVENNNLPMVKYIIKNTSVEVNNEVEDYLMRRRSPLFSAVNEMNLPMVKFLVLKAGADVLQTDEKRNLPLHLAAADPNGNGNLVKFLLEQCENNVQPQIQQRNKAGNTPLDEALKHNNINVANILRQYDPVLVLQSKLEEKEEEIKQLL
eukprot:Pgem_evm1s18724